MVWNKKSLTMKGEREMMNIQQENRDRDRDPGSGAYFLKRGNLGSTAPKYVIGLKNRTDQGPPNSLVQPVDTYGMFVFT